VIVFIVLLVLALFLIDPWAKLLAISTGELDFTLIVFIPDHSLSSVFQKRYELANSVRRPSSIATARFEHGCPREGRL
jgi:hypothetical protein